MGAVDGALAVADFSSRGPASCAGELYPEVVAPGVAVRTARARLGLGVVIRREQDFLEVSPQDMELRLLFKPVTLTVRCWFVVDKN